MAHPQPSSPAGIVWGLSGGRTIVHDQPLIGRMRERSEIARAAARARDRHGALLLLAGEAGVGKTHLAEDALAHSGLLVLHGAVSQDATPPYGPLVAALRAYRRTVPDGLADCGPLSAHLALLLPELGPAAEQSDRSTVFEAICAAFAAIARQQPTAVILDDLQWADSTTLELLPALAVWIEHEPMLIVGAYRNDEIPRGHPLRRTRTGLRRAGRLREIAVEPLDREETAALAARVLGRMPSPALIAALHDRTQGVPFFVEELSAALIASGRLKDGEAGADLAIGEHVPIPETVRDAVLLQAHSLDEPARKVLEIAAVAGIEFDIQLVAELAGGDAVFEQPIERGLLVEVMPGRAVFRHALTWEALYGDIPWPRRRALHRALAACLDGRGFPPGVVAEHWLAAREVDRARSCLLAAAQASCSVHAYRDAAQATRRALELWPEGEEEAVRIDVLDRLGQCAELCGEFSEAIRAWQEVADARRQAGQQRELAEVERRLAAVYELQSLWEQALEARRNAAEAFAASGLPGEAAEERLAAAEHLQHAGSFSVALELVADAAADASEARRIDLQVRTLGLEGSIRTNLGQIDTGIETIRVALAHALDHNLSGPAAEIYYRLAVALDQASDYVAARDAYSTAIGFCQARGISEVEHICAACLTVVLRQTGEWTRAGEHCREILASVDAPPPARAVAAGILGSLQAHQGERARTHRLLLESNVQARRFQLAPLELDTLWSLAVADELTGAEDSAADRYRLVRQRWEQTEDRHYAIAPLRWAATFIATRRAEADTCACAQALAKIAAGLGNVEALAALAHALGECALLDGDAHKAALQFGQALEFLRRLEAPFQRVHTQVRAGVAFAAAGQRQAGIESLTGAYRTARKLGARPLAAQAAQELAALGEQVERRLGRRAAGQLQRAGLSRREMEVLRLISLGRTNREIGQELFLSPRTVEMYVSNILTKLGCSSRAQATHRAHELRLLPQG